MPRISAQYSNYTAKSLISATSICSTVTVFCHKCVRFQCKIAAPNYLLTVGHFSSLQYTSLAALNTFKNCAVNIMPHSLFKQTPGQTNASSEVTRVWYSCMWCFCATLMISRRVGLEESFVSVKWRKPRRVKSAIYVVLDGGDAPNRPSHGGGAKDLSAVRRVRTVCE